MTRKLTDNQPAASGEPAPSPAHIPACEGGGIDADTGRLLGCVPADGGDEWYFDPDPINDPDPLAFNLAREQLPEGAPLCAVWARASRIRAEWVPPSSPNVVRAFKDRPPM